MKGVIGKKLGMTQIYAADGQAVPVTVLDVSASTVLQVKTTETDGYEAIQVGYGGKKIHRTSKANRVRAEKAGLGTAPVKVREFRTPDASRFQVGDRITVEFFQEGDLVKVTGTSKGRGFTGAMKRHGFAGGTRKSHGGGPSHRGVGSAGMSADPSRTPKGRKLPGQYGNQQASIRGLTVVQVDPENEILLVKGAVPGPVNGLVTIELMDAEVREYVPASRQEAEEREAGEVAEAEGPEETAEESAEAEGAEAEEAEEAEAESGETGAEAQAEADEEVEAAEDDEEKSE